VVVVATRSKAKKDPELVRQLDRARNSGEPVRAVVSVRRTRGEAPQPAQIEELVRDAFERTSEATGQQPDDYHVFGRMASAYVTAPADFITALVDQPEIESAVANQRA
jgi:non-canonical (house-cleaning) NTP pyrophosphatase